MNPTADPGGDPATDPAIDIDIDLLRTWVGRSTVLHDQVGTAPLHALTATLDRDDAPVQPGQALPPCWHWLYFLPVHRQSEIGADGHPQRGGFLPPVPLPRRMWAGSRLAFLSPITLAQRLQRTSTITDVRLKAGRSGPLVFVQVQHAVTADGVPAIEEVHDIVYRGAAQPTPPGPAVPAAAAGQPAPADAPWSRRVVPDDVLLFRYSALTFNGHRIHYDRVYATGAEGYPGLVVHGPLIATLLLDLLRRECPQARVTRFEFRALQPLFDTAPFVLCGRMDSAHSVRLWALTPEGQVAMDASATLA